MEDQRRRGAVKVELKIWRYDASTGERALRSTRSTSPRRRRCSTRSTSSRTSVDGSLAYRKSCRMMICGSCGMRVDGGAVLACKTRIADVVAGRPRAGDLGDGQPADREGPRRRHGSVLAEDARRPAVPGAAATTGRPRRRTSSRRSRWTSIHKESLCINCGCCVSECNSMESDPDFLGPAALAKGFRFVGDARDGARSSGSSATPRRTASGTARAATSATSAARRASTRATRSRSSAPRR